MGFRGCFEGIQGIFKDFRGFKKVPEEYLSEKIQWRFRRPPGLLRGIRGLQRFIIIIYINGIFSPGLVHLSAFKSVLGTLWSVSGRFMGFHEVGGSSEAFQSYHRDRAFQVFFKRFQGLLGVFQEVWEFPGVFSHTPTFHTLEFQGLSRGFTRDLRGTFDVLLRGYRVSRHFTDVPGDHRRF